DGTGTRACNAAQQRHRCSSLFGRDEPPALIELGRQRTADFGTPTHGDRYCTVSQIKRVCVAAGTGAPCAHDGSMVRTASRMWPRHALPLQVTSCTCRPSGRIFLAHSL